MSKKTTLTEAIQSFLNQENKGITFINGDSQEETISYKELYANAEMVLYQLQAIGMKPGHELVFQIQDYKDFITVFWACLLGKIVPIPLSVGDNDEHKHKVFKVFNILKNPYLVAEQDVLTKIKAFGEKNTYINEISDFESRIILIDDIKVLTEPGEVQYAKPEDIAFIQFSSGSTGDPKGVVLTHENLITNLYAIANCAGWKSEDRILCWMPLTHDMGLIGCHLTPLLNRMNQYHMPTSLFIRRPSLWLKKASQHRIAILQSPNFGYKFFLSYFKPKMAEDWDLSSVKQIMNGAEPISYEVCTKFLDEMEKYGLDRNAMFTVYGLAEATVGVSFPRPGEEVVTLHLDRERLNVGEMVREVDPDDPSHICFVDEGYPIDDCYIRICDYNDLEVSEEIVGHIHISGKNVMSGYYNNEQATERVITQDGWVRTGDLGFMKNGRLVVTGRAKDIIFVNGINYYPHDIERVAEEVNGVELGRVAACGVYNSKKQRDEILIFVVSRKKTNDFLSILQDVKMKIRTKMNLNVDAVIPIRTMPKTTSGKIQRYKLGQQFINGEFDEVKAELDASIKAVQDCEFKEAGSEMEKKLLEICRDVLKMDEIGVNERFLEMGIDSLKVNQIVKRVDQFYPGMLKATDLFSYPTIAAVAKYFESQNKVHLPSITLPKTYMTGDMSHRFVRASFEFVVQGEVLHGLTNFVEKQKVDVDTVLMSGLAYLLASISGERELVLQTIINTNDFIKSVYVDFKEEQNQNRLYQSVNEQIFREDELIPVQSLNQVTMDGEHGSVVPFYVRTEYVKRNARVLDMQDLVIEVDEKKSDIIVRCHFNSRKLKSKMMKELMFNYMRFVKMTIGQNQSNESVVLQ